jgi:hypothetical protein
MTLAPSALDFQAKKLKITRKKKIHILLSLGKNPFQDRHLLLHTLNFTLTALNLPKQVRNATGCLRRLLWHAAQDSELGLRITNGLGLDAREFLEHAEIHLCAEHGVRSNSSIRGATERSAGSDVCGVAPGTRDGDEFEGG